MAVGVATCSGAQDRNRTLFLTVGCLVLVNSLTSPSGIPAIPLQFYLKDRLHLSPDAIALFGLVSGIPLYLSFVFGFVRDRWSPFRLGDRGHFLFFAPLAAAVYFWIPSGGMGWKPLLAGIMLVTALYRMLAGAQTGLIASMARRDGTTGAFSALSTSLITLSAVAAPLLGGWLTARFGAPSVYPITALGALLLFGLALRGSRSVFQQPKSPAEGPARRPGGEWAEIKRLLCYRPLWPALLICALWQFSPGFQTPLFFHLTGTIGLRAESYGQFLAAFNLALMAVMALYGPLCRRIDFARILRWGTWIAIPQMLLLLCIHSPLQAMLCAVLMGVMAGTAAAAYFDLLVRSCPPGLEGTGMMLGSAVSFLAVRGADVVGTWLYQRGCFSWCALATVAVCACIVPALSLLPRSTLQPVEDP
ncbi:MAG TPA: MFS transporter [Chthonomonadaceae bacterium]|nr:MFS transporter [Chthonomonadaceae bacterium]